MPANESLATRTFVELADALVDDFDVVDLLTTLANRCAALLDVGAAGVLLTDQGGALQVMATAGEQSGLAQVFRLLSREGPCPECSATGRPVPNQALAGDDRWPRLGPAALAAGFVGVTALPLRLRDSVIGALAVLMDDRMDLDEEELALAQALADAATVAILQARAAHDAAVLAAGLRSALDDRIAVERASGILAERLGLDVGEAFARLRGYARDRGRRLAAVAAELIDGMLPAEVLVGRGDAG